ncbi:MAG: response regulator [Ardenticatenales bacterium]|nr:response regulator [Ardenticatenales bacterium]
MIVDDSQTVRLMVRRTLERLGYQILEAQDGFEALAHLANRRPDLILLDITMPRMDGYKVCRLIKENENTRHIPVVMLSGKDGFFDKVKGKLAGAADYITKPFEQSELFLAIQSHLDMG